MLWCCAGPGEQQWAHLESKRPHTHDVRALAVVHVAGQEPLLASAGNDTQILVSHVLRFQQVHPLLTLSLASVPFADCWIQVEVFLLPVWAFSMARLRCKLACQGLDSKRVASTIVRESICRRCCAVFEIASMS